MDGDAHIGCSQNNFPEVKFLSLYGKWKRRRTGGTKGRRSLGDAWWRRSCGTGRSSVGGLAEVLGSELKVEGDEK
jgi:hypothetical protein